MALVVVGIQFQEMARIRGIPLAPLVLCDTSASQSTRAAGLQRHQQLADERAVYYGRQ